MATDGHRVFRKLLDSKIVVILVSELPLTLAGGSKMRKGLLMILTAAMLTLAPISASAAVRGFVVVGRPYYGGWYAPYWGPYWGGVQPTAVTTTGNVTQVKSN